MNFLLSYKLFEKTSLINIDVPYQVMQGIQKDYAISSNAEWKRLQYKKNIIAALHKPQNTLIISVCENEILISFSHNKDFYIENYIISEKDDFGNIQWVRSERTKTTITDCVKKIERKCKSYELVYGSWLHEFRKIRKIRKEESDFEKITNEFKRDFAENFTNIIKKLYGKKANIITDIIVNHLKNVKKGITDEQIRDILFLNVERAKEADFFKKKQKEKDPYHLYNEIIRADSLTIFNEYLIRFEDDYSEKYKEYLNIPIMIEKFGRDKIMTAFMIYLYTKKLIIL